MDGEVVDRLFDDLFVQAHEQAPRRIVLDLDATDDPLHARQEGRFFHGFYGSCLLPAAVHLLWGSSGCAQD